jgi:hypothetical protein
LVNKWSALSKEQSAKEEAARQRAEREADPKVQQHKHKLKIEQWKADQIESGEALNNPNFVPVSDNWRQKLQAKKGAGSKF